MYHKTVCKNHTLTLQEKDVLEAQLILKEMIKTGASRKYPYYDRYKDAFDLFIQQVHEINHIQHYETTEPTVPPFMEDDKTLLVKPKSKSILELFSKVKKI
jgi:hypothetical protein